MVKDNIKYRIIIGLLISVAHLPLRVLYVFSDIAYLSIYYVVRYRRKTVRHNLEMVFGTADRKRIIAIEKKFYRHHTGWIGGLKEIRYDRLMAENPEKAMMLAIKGMIPDTTIGRKALTRCRIFAGAEHNHAAQKPEAWNL